MLFIEQSVEYCRALLTVVRRQWTLGFVHKLTLVVSMVHLWGRCTALWTTVPPGVMRWWRRLSAC